MSQAEPLDRGPPARTRTTPSSSTMGVHQVHGPRRPAPQAKVTTAAAITTRWCVGVIAFRWWQARRIPAGSKIVKSRGCAAEVGRLRLMRVVLAGVCELMPLCGHREVGSAVVALL
jgi:hypothetical protein